MTRKFEIEIDDDLTPTVDMSDGVEASDETKNALKDAVIDLYLELKKIDESEGEG
mgnify:CR=1 FL=1